MVTKIKERNFVPRGLTVIVPPTGKTVDYKVELRSGKRTVIRQIFADNNSKVTMTMSRPGSEANVENVALSVMALDKPLPVKIPMGDYKISFSSTSSTDEAINLAFITELL